LKRDKEIKISLVTTCKGRLDYLKDSLSTWVNLDYSDYEIVVVDYDCPDGTADYIYKNKKKILKGNKEADICVVEVKRKPLFNLNDARNRGIRSATGDLVLVIDSDVHIRDKNILRKINRWHQKGAVFFPLYQMLNSNYFEASYYYRDLFYVDIFLPCIVSCGVLVPELSGTACFDKKLFLSCGGYDPKISEGGYGWDEIEFYLRFVNHYFYNYYLKKNKGAYKSIENALDKVLSKFKILPASSFSTLENMEEERDRFYPDSLQETMKSNKQFIRDFFNNELPDLYKRSKINKSPFKINFKNLLDDDSLKQIPVAKWYLPQVYVWHGDHLFRSGQIEASKKILEKGLKIKNSPARYRAMICSILQKISELEGGKDSLKYIKKRLNILMHTGKRSFADNYDIGKMLFETGGLEACEKWFKKMLKKRQVPANIRSGIYFYLGDIYKLKGNELWKHYYHEAIKTLEEKQHKRDLDIYQIASLYKRISNFKAAKEKFYSLLEFVTHEPTVMGVYFHLAHIYHLEGENNKSKDFAVRCLRINPEHMKARQLLEERESL
jgi:glycosyltransferase involved in cell wall biosynthesis